MVLRSAVLILLVALAGCAGHAMHGEGRSAAAPASPEAGQPANFAAEMDTAMERMMRDMHAPGYRGDPDVDFLAMMIPHHEGAIEMARLVLVHGRDPLVRRLAEEIIAGQATEIQAMRARLALLARGRDPEPDGFPALGSTRGPAR